MKKRLFYFVAAGIIALTACSGKAETNPSGEMTDDALAQNEVQAAEQSSQNTTPQNVYKITNNKIVPSNGLPTIADFSATWCPPCRLLKPVFANLKQEYNGNVNFITIDIDEYPDVAKTYGVTAIPTLIYLDSKGNVLKQTQGFESAEQSVQEISSNITNLFK